MEISSGNVIGILCAIIMALCMYVLRKIDANQTRLFELHSDVDSRLTVVETKCEINHGSNGASPQHRRKTDSKP